MLVSTPELRSALLFTGELLRLLDLFDSHHIAALPFKGPVLADMLYGDIAARDYCDLDILVPKPDTSRVINVLLDAGYTADLPTDSGQRAAYLRARYEIHFTSPDGAIPIEIHQSFLPPAYSFRLAPRIDRRMFLGRDIPAMAPADLLLLLCAHGAKHAWSEPALIRDVARLVEVFANEIRWPDLLQDARSIGALRLLRLGLYLAARQNAPVPAEVLSAAENDKAIVRLAGRIRTDAPESPSFFIATRERLRDKLACYARLAFTPNEEDYSLLPLPAILSPLYYPLHALRVAGKFGRGR
ncbi:MAG: nucleotidyltransferase family protein [Bryobacteraceae bacterium]